MWLSALFLGQLTFLWWIPGVMIWPAAQPANACFFRFRGHVPVSEDVPIDEAPGELALMMNGNSMGLR